MRGGVAAPLRDARQRPRARRDQRVSAAFSGPSGNRSPSSNSGSACPAIPRSRCIAVAPPRDAHDLDANADFAAIDAVASKRAAQIRRTVAQRRSDRARGCRDLQDAFPPVGHVHPLGNRSRQMPADALRQLGLAAMPRRPFDELRVRLEHGRKRSVFWRCAQRLSRGMGSGGIEHHPGGRRHRGGACRRPPARRLDMVGWSTSTKATV